MQYKIKCNNARERLGVLAYFVQLGYRIHTQGMSVLSFDKGYPYGDYKYVCLNTGDDTIGGCGEGTLYKEITMSDLPKNIIGEKPLFIGQYEVKKSTTHALVGCQKVTLEDIRAVCKLMKWRL